MLNHWLMPVDPQLQLWAKSLSVGHLGKQIDFESGQWKKLPKSGLVILGMETQSANAIRRALYEFASLSEKLKICDLGDLRKPDTDFCLPLLQELLGAGHLVVCIGAGEETGLTQFLAYRDFRRVSNLAVIDHRLDLALKDCPSFKTGVWQQVLSPLHKRLFHFCLLASQSHLVPDQIGRFIDKKGFDHLRLGVLRADIGAAEPAIRDMDLVAVHLRVLRTHLGDSHLVGSGSGLTIEELCQIARYAGLSEKVSSISFYGSAEIPTRSEAAAQAVWYFLEGVTHRCGDFPASVHGMTEYIVDMQKLKYQLTFWKSNRSGRWWVQVPVHIERNKERHKLVPCTYSDYQQASKEELSDRLMRAFERFM